MKKLTAIFLLLLCLCACQVNKRQAEIITEVTPPAVTVIDQIEICKIAYTDATTNKARVIEKDKQLLNAGECINEGEVCIIQEKVEECGEIKQTILVNDRAVIVIWEPHVIPISNKVIYTTKHIIDNKKVVVAGQ